MAKIRNRKDIDINAVFPVMIALGSKTVAHTLIPSFENPNGRFCQDPEILLPWSLDVTLLSFEKSRLIEVSLHFNLVHLLNYGLYKSKLLAETFILCCPQCDTNIMYLNI